MKAIKFKQLDEKDEEISDAFISLGMSRPVARTLSYLNTADGATSRGIEKGAGLRQPEISLAVKELKERNWINEQEDKKPGKGRPYKIYSLKIGFDEIVLQLEKQQKKEIDKSLAMIERLKELGK